MKKFKASYSYPLEHPIKVVVERIGRQGLVAWLMQKYGQNVDINKDLVISERIIELPMLHEWIGAIFPKREGKVLEIGHVASSTALELASLGFDMTAIDLRPYPFKHKNLTSLQGDFLAHSFSEKFDFIYSLSTIEHFGFSKRYGGDDISDNKLDEEAFKKISESLKQGGRAVVSFPYALSHVPGIWFRVYTREELEQKLSKYFKLEQSCYYRRDRNEWTRVDDRKGDPASPHDGVALFLLSPKQ